MTKRILAPLALILALTLSVTAYAGDIFIHGYFRYTVDNGSVTITRYTGPETAVAVPAMIGGDPVNTIGAGAFAGKPAVRRVYLPDTVTTVEAGAFAEGQVAVFYCITPEIAAVETSPEGTRVTAYAKPGTLLLCAAYDGSGRLLATEARTVAADQSVYPFDLTGGSSVKVFLVDGDFRPLCPCETK
jgi:hypothetical protein